MSEPNETVYMGPIECILYMGQHPEVLNGIIERSIDAHVVAEWNEFFRTNRFMKKRLEMMKETIKVDDIKDISDRILACTYLVFRQDSPHCFNWAIHYHLEAVAQIMFEYFAMIKITAFENDFSFISTTLFHYLSELTNLLAADSVLQEKQISHLSIFDTLAKQHLEDERFREFLKDHYATLVERWTEFLKENKQKFH